MFESEAMMKKERMNSLREFTKNWYTLSRSFLPEFGSETFNRFAAEGNTLAYDTVSRKLDDTPMTLHVTKDTDTAYVDLSTNSIYLSSKYFTEDLYDKLVGETEDLEEIAIGLINGSIIHEALHVQHTTAKTIEAAMKTNPVRWERAVNKFGKQAVCFMFNIIEDLYIESQVSDKFAKWIEASDNILFTEESFEQRDLEDIFAVINLAVIYKNKNLRDNPEFDRLPIAALESLMKVSEGNELSLYQRVTETYNFLDCFDFGTPESESKSGGSESGDGSSDDSGETGIDTEDPMPSGTKELLDSVEDLSDEEIEALEELLSRISEEIAEEESSEHKFEAGGSECRFSDIVEEDIMKARIGGTTVWPESKTDYSFLKELVASRTINRTPGQARTSGSVMVKQRLTRIATDGKIFAKRDSEKAQKSRIEIIINVDFSASTRGSIIDNEVGAAMEISNVLRQANIPHSVYGHTSKGGYRPYVVHIFSHLMEVTNTDWEARFERACSIRLAENYDGVIINHLAEQFTKRNATRYMINLSDGAPCGPGYRNDAADAHTKKAIQDARAKGIKVFAVSVVSHVVKNNNNFYGTDYNVDASSNVAAQFRALIGRLLGV